MKLGWTDGYEGMVHLRPIIAEGEISEYPRDPANFPKIALSDEYGHSILWRDETGYEVDFSADQLRRDAEEQAELHRFAV